MRPFVYERIKNLKNEFYKSYNQTRCVLTNDEQVKDFYVNYEYFYIKVPHIWSIKLSYKDESKRSWALEVGEFEFTVSEDYNEEEQEILLKELYRYLKEQSFLCR